jgi:hypothetical protein
MDNQELKFDAVSMRVLRAFTSKFESLSDEEELGFDVVMLALFPSAYLRIQRYVTDCYTQGYLAGRAKTEEEKEENEN